MAPSSLFLTFHLTWQTKHAHLPCMLAGMRQSRGHETRAREQGHAKNMMKNADSWHAQHSSKQPRCPGQAPAWNINLGLFQLTNDIATMNKFSNSYISLSLPLSLPNKSFPFIKNCETRLIKGRKVISITQSSFTVIFIPILVLFSRILSKKIRLQVHIIWSVTLINSVFGNNNNNKGTFKNDVSQLGWFSSLKWGEGVDIFVTSH